tara:strand:+ start:903 stop:1277 length:375 start_codon:yes stop_codon:yes gene_type:complete
LFLKIGASMEEDIRVTQLPAELFDDERRIVRRRVLRGCVSWLPSILLFGFLLLVSGCDPLISVGIVFIIIVLLSLRGMFILLQEFEAIRNLYTNPDLLDKLNMEINAQVEQVRKSRPSSENHKD